MVRVRAGKGDAGLNELQETPPMKRRSFLKGASLGAAGRLVP
jgi:hypothetical protein